jgi:hypothetical protein
MRRTRIALVLVGVLALVGGGTALASKGKGKSRKQHATLTAAVRAAHGPGDDLEAAATYLGTTAASLQTQLQAGKTLAQIASATSGKSTAGLIAALVAHEQTEIADAVKAGKLTQVQADQITASLQQRFTDFVNNIRPPHGGGPRHFALDLLSTAAAYLGTTPSALMTQLQSGKTLAQIANAPSGKSASGLIDALVAAAKAKLGANAPSDLQQHITDAVNGVRPAGPPPGDRHGWGPPAGGAGTFGFRNGGTPTFRPAMGSNA